MKKTLLILVVLFASVTSSFAQYTAHNYIYWTGSSYFPSSSWIVANGKPGSGEPSYQNVQLNINSNIYALELYGYTFKSYGWVSIEAYDTAYSYYRDIFHNQPDPYNSSSPIRDLFYDTQNPLYIETLFVNMVTSGDAAGRLIVNWAAI